MVVYPTKRQDTMYLLKEEPNAISKIVIIKIKLLSDQTSGPNYQLTENTDVRITCQTMPAKSGLWYSMGQMTCFYQQQQQQQKMQEKELRSKSKLQIQRDLKNFSTASNVWIFFI